MRILIVSPHFPPSNAADMHRVRLLLPHWEGMGCDVEVLAVAPEKVAVAKEDWFAAGLPRSFPVHRVQALGLGWGRIPGLGSLAFRALSALRREGDALLSQRSFDLIYFSTTQFGVHVLGPYWQKKFGVPFAMDYQDPWVSDYYRSHPQVIPPGGRFKFALIDRVHRRQEPQVLRCCSGITSVSPDYPRQLQSRYSWLSIRPVSSTPCPTQTESRPCSGDRTSEVILPSLVLPFPGDEIDFERVRASGVQQEVFSPRDGRTHWVYAGRGGKDMHRALSGLFLALRQALDQGLIAADRLCLHFIGTSYASGGRAQKTVESLARALGVSAVVNEVALRIPYSQALRCLLDAAALIVPGSDDPGYTASKIYPYLLAGKPLLTVFHENSSVVELIKRVGGGQCVAFNHFESTHALADRIRNSWFHDRQFERVIALDREAFEPYTARMQARVLNDFFQMIR